MENEILQSNCTKCTAPLGSDSKLQGYHLCHKCRFCQVCHGLLSPTESRIPFSIGTNDDGSTKVPFISHIRCSPFAPKREIPDSVQEVTQSHLDYLNAFRLCLEPQVELSVEGNRQGAAIASRKLITEMEPDTLILLVARIETFMADVSCALSKKLVSVKAIQGQRDVERLNEVNEERAKPSTPKIAKKIESREERAGKVLEGFLGKDLALEFQQKLAERLKAPTSVGILDKPN